jgi:hypothetical protein
MRASAARCSPPSREGCRGAFAVDEPVRAKSVEAQNPVAHDLEPDPTDLGRLARLAPS